MLEQWVRRQADGLRCDSQPVAAAGYAPAQASRAPPHWSRCHPATRTGWTSNPAVRRRLQPPPHTEAAPNPLALPPPTASLPSQFAPTHLLGQSGNTRRIPDDGRRTRENQRIMSKSGASRLAGRTINHQQSRHRSGRQVAGSRRADGGWLHPAAGQRTGPPGAHLGPGRLLSRPRRCFGRWKRTQCPSSCWSSVSRKIRTIRRTSARWCCSCRIRTGKPFPQNSRFRRRIWTRSSAPAACRCVRLGPLFQ